MDKSMKFIKKNIGSGFDSEAYWTEYDYLEFINDENRFSKEFNSLRTGNTFELTVKKNEDIRNSIVIKYNRLTNFNHYISGSCVSNGDVKHLMHIMYRMFYALITSRVYSEDEIKKDNEEYPYYMTYTLGDFVVVREHIENENNDTENGMVNDVKWTVYLPMHCQYDKIYIGN